MITNQKKLMKEGDLEGAIDSTYESNLHTASLFPPAQCTNKEELKKRNRKTNRKNTQLWSNRTNKKRS
jgi:hypothetical protein